MLNLQPKSINSLIVYADTITGSVGDYFLINFRNGFSKQIFGVVPKIIRRNKRFVEFEIELVGVNGLDDPEDAQIYLFPEGNFTYEVFNTSVPVTNLTPGECLIWNTADVFWQLANSLWNRCEEPFAIKQVDAGQAFLYSELPCEREVEFVPYEGGNNFLDAIVYVTGVPLWQFPCVIKSGTVYVVQENTTTFCGTVTIEDDADLIIAEDKFLKILEEKYVC